MSQGALRFKNEKQKHDTGITGLAGLPVYLDLMHTMGSDVTDFSVYSSI
ncbi:MAG: hypothetical protein JXB09_07525 [Deltaproteobacteria bacterium]|nr:hypothetical protein [Deltaproteobacteria bacterium]